MEDEISIRDLINFIKKYFWFAMFTMFVSGGGYILVSLLKPAMYTGSVSFLINQATVVTQEGDIRKIGLSPEFYKALLREDTFLTKLILSHKELQNISKDKLKKEIKIEARSDIVNLIYKDPNPQVVKLVLEVISDGLSTQVKKMRDSQRGLLGTIQEPRHMLEKNMVTLAKKIEMYKKEKNINELRRKLSMYDNLINDYEARLLKLSDEIKILERNLVETEEYLKKEEERLKLSKKSIGRDIKLYEAAKANSDKKISESLQLKTEEEVINPIYQSLKSQFINLNIRLSDLKNQKEILLPKLEEVTKEANKLRADLITIEQELSEMQLEYEVLRSRYLELIKNETNVQAFGPYSIGDITFLSPVYVSEKPESKIKMKWLCISGLFGLFIGIIFGFLREAYYKSEKMV